MVGELVLPDVIVRHHRGIDDAKPFEPEHAKPLVDQRQRVASQTHLRRADRMEDGGADIACRFDQACRRKLGCPAVGAASRRTSQ